jgi:hypothetical protein
VSVLDRLVVALLSPQAVGIWLPLLVGGIVALARAVAKDKAQRVLDALDVATSHAYHATNEYVLRRRQAGDHVNGNLDKATFALGLFSEALQRELKRDPTRAEREGAKLAWSAMHGQERVQRQLAAPVADLAPARSRAG